MKINLFQTGLQDLTYLQETLHIPKIVTFCSLTKFYFDSAGEPVGPSQRKIMDKNIARRTEFELAGI